MKISLPIPEPPSASISSVPTPHPTQHLRIGVQAIPFSPAFSSSRLGSFCRCWSMKYFIRAKPPEHVSAAGAQQEWRHREQSYSPTCPCTFPPSCADLFLSAPAIPAPCLHAAKAPQPVPFRALMPFIPWFIHDLSHSACTQSVLASMRLCCKEYARGRKYKARETCLSEGAWQQPRPSLCLGDQKERQL